MKENKGKRIILLIAAGCVVLGMLLTFVGVIFGGTIGFKLDETGIHDASYTQEHAVQKMEKTKIDAFDAVDINVDYADIEISPADGYYLEYQLQGENKEPEYTVKDKKLTFLDKSTGSFQVDFTFFSFTSDDNANYVKLYLPEDIYMKMIKLSTGSGDVEIHDSIQGDELMIDDDYGDVSINAFEGKKLEVNLGSGEMEAGRLISDSLKVNDDYGSVQIKELKCGSADITMGSGDVELEKAEFDQIKIHDDYGDVTVGLLQDIKKYSMDLVTEYGEIELPDNSGFSTDDSGAEYRTTDGTDGEIEVRADSGDIEMKKAR